MASHNCPLYTTNKSKILQYLHSLPFNELRHIVEQVQFSLSPTENIRYNINMYCTGHADFSGRVKFLLTLINDGVIYPLALPSSFERDPHLAKLARPQKIESHTLPVNDKAVSEPEALTDELADIMTGEKKPVTVTNPRWEHVDEEKKSNTPSTVAIGDEVNLYVDVTGVPNGSRVTFDIFDVSSNPPMRIATASGKNEQGTACSKWTVDEPLATDNVFKLEFEGIAKSKSSERAEINCIRKEPIGCVVLCIKDNISDSGIGDTECILKGDKNEYSGKTDENGLVAWNDIPLDQYTLKINIDSQEVTKSVFWKKDSLKTQNVRIRRL